MMQMGSLLPLFPENLSLSTIVLQQTTTKISVENNNKHLFCWHICGLNGLVEDQMI